MKSVKILWKLIMEIVTVVIVAIIVFSLMNSNV